MVDGSSSCMSRLIGEFIRKEVADWDDEVMATARFKAFSGQRSDWEPKYYFWRDLILKVAAHLGVFLFHPLEVSSRPSTIFTTRGTLIFVFSPSFGAFWA
ncbi:hypothetical protein U1Q18_034550 [Sarracenia purpurea var. burkii]